MISGWQNGVWFRRAAFVTGNLAVIALIAGLLVAPIYSFFARQNTRIAEQRELIGRLRGIIAREALVKELAREAEAQVQAGEFLRGPSDGVITADLQTRLKSIAESAGARLRSVQTLPASTKEEIRYIGSRMEVSGSIQT